MRSWVFRHRERLEAIYRRGPRASESEDSASVERRAEDASGLGVLVLVPRRRVHAA